jgi:hypothetical protein
MPVIPALGKLRQEEHQLDASLGYIVRPIEKERERRRRRRRRRRKRRKGRRRRGGRKEREKEKKGRD